jgi:hypothetical protein
MKLEKSERVGVFGGVCLKKLEPISSRTPDFARAERVVA